MDNASFILSTANKLIYKCPECNGFLVKVPIGVSFNYGGLEPILPTADYYLLGCAKCPYAKTITKEFIHRGQGNFKNGTVRSKIRKND